MTQLPHGGMHTFNRDEIKIKKQKYFYLVSLGIRQFNMEEEDVILILQLYSKQTDNVCSFSTFKVCIKKSKHGRFNYTWPS